MIDNDIAAYIGEVASLTTGGGDVTVTATETATIEAITVAAAIAAGVSLGGSGVAVSGGGAIASNVILTRTNAFVRNSALGAALDPIGGLDIDASSDSSISAFIGAVSAAVSFGSSNGVGVSIGISLARNYIGWDPFVSVPDAGHTSDEDLATLSAGDTVRIKDGEARAGDVYEYIGPTLTDGDPNTDGVQAIDLDTQNYQDSDVWRQINLTESPSEVRAYLLNTSVIASGALTVDAVASQTVDAVVVAGSAALSGGGSTGVAVSGAGAIAHNRVEVHVKAFIDGDGDEGISADSVTLTAEGCLGHPVDHRSRVARRVGCRQHRLLGIHRAVDVVSTKCRTRSRPTSPTPDQGVTTTGLVDEGDVTVSALSKGLPLFDIDLTAGRLRRRRSRRRGKG